MKFFVETGYYGENSKEIISEKIFREIVKSRQVLSVALSLEQKYEILIQNYLEFENQLLKYGTLITVRSDLGVVDFFEMIVSFNRLMVNLLTSTRLYTDQTLKDITPELFGRTVSKDKIKKLFSAEYDTHKEFRFMERLRNYVQHCGLAVHTVTKGVSQRKFNDNNFVECNVDLFAIKSKLQEDKMFKGSKLNEFEDNIDVKKVVRRYIGCLSAIHKEIRELTEKRTCIARKKIEEFIANYKPDDKDSWPMSVYSIDEDGTITTVPVVLDWDDIRIELMNRNKVLINLPEIYVSNIVGQ